MLGWCARQLYGAYASNVNADTLPPIKFCDFVAGDTEAEEGRHVAKRAEKVDVAFPHPVNGADSCGVEVVVVVMRNDDEVDVWDGGNGAGDGRVPGMDGQWM